MEISECLSTVLMYVVEMMVKPIHEIWPGVHDDDCGDRRVCCIGDDKRHGRIAWSEIVRYTTWLVACWHDNADAKHGAPRFGSNHMQRTVNACRFQG